MPQRSLNGNKNGHKKGHGGKSGAARPIRSKRDYFHAANIVEQLKKEVDRESVAEMRLQALIHEMEKYDADEMDFYESDFSFEDEYDGPLRRWSDDPNDLD
jgi:hypothetical protein